MAFKKRRKNVLAIAKDFFNVPLQGADFFKDHDNLEKMEIKYNAGDEVVKIIAYFLDGSISRQKRIRPKSLDITETQTATWYPWESVP